MRSEIRGEYWVIDGSVNFADGDVGDWNHEAMAANHIAAKHIEDIANIANEMGAEIGNMSRYWHSEYPVQDAGDLRDKIAEAMEEKGERSEDVDDLIQKKLGVGDEEYSLIYGNGDARLFVMEKEGWIAIRSNNAELAGYANKRGELASGIEEIMEQEGIDAADEEMEISVYDHKTGRSFEATLADIKGASSMRPQTLPTTTYNTPLMVPADRSKPMGSQSPKSIDIKTRNSVQTSESRMGFRQWLQENCEPFIVRRNWPFLSGEDEAPPNRPISRRNRRVRRR